MGQQSQPASQPTFTSREGGGKGVYQRSTSNMNWINQVIAEEDDRKKRLASWDALATRICRIGWQHGPSYEKLVGLPLDFSRPTWDPASGEPRLVWTGCMLVAAVDAVWYHSEDHRAKMVAHG